MELEENAGKTAEKKGIKRMKYIIMCGGEYVRFGTPRQLWPFMGEKIVDRTIRLLHENGVTDIAISSNDDRFEGHGVPVLRHENDYVTRAHNNSDGEWCNCFYPTDEPTCYIFGDVVYSNTAIKTIVETKTDDIMFFGSAPPFPDEYVKPWIEPFGFKVEDPDHLKRAVEDVKRLHREGRFNREPIAWEVWNVISRGPEGDVNTIDYGSYVHINDWTCDIDTPDEIGLLETMAERARQ